MALLSPSILAADFADLKRAAADAKNGGAPLLHIDVMDGHFVPNISFGACVLRSLSSYDHPPFDVHLMIEEPDRYIEDFSLADTEYITVHIEAARHIDRTIEHIRSLGKRPGVALNPGTPVSLLENVLPLSDMILVMSVNPGFGGQKFIDYSLDKIRELARIREDRGLDFAIEIDGGVTLDNCRDIADAGTDILVAGSSVYGTEEPEKTVRIFSELIG